MNTQTTCVLWRRIQRAQPLTVAALVFIGCAQNPAPPPSAPVAMRDTTQTTSTTSTANVVNFQDGSAALPPITAGPTMDVTAADLDGDGDQDLVLAIEFAPNAILINDGRGVFTNETASRLPAINRDSEDIAVADFDKDGDMDIIFVSEDDLRLNRRPTHEYYLNNGRGVFTAAPFTLPDSEANAIAVADINGDTFPDLVVGNAGQDFILINDGRGGFRNETEERLPVLDDVTQDVKLADIDGDRDLDIFLANEDRNKILVNNGRGVFTDRTTHNLSSRFVNLSAMETRKATFEDVDGDGDVDLFLANVAFIPTKNPQARLFINDGNGNFSDVTGARFPSNNAFTLDGLFLDLDDDGDRDLVTVGFGTTVPFSTYINNGRGEFQVAQRPPFGRAIFGRGISMEVADFNNDRKPDVYMGLHGEADQLFLSRRP
jgi:hypothetical protein